MPSQQLAYVQAAASAQLTIDTLTLMTMNMGGKDNVADTKTAISGGAAQLAGVYKISTDDAIKKMGMLPAIGVDNNGVVVNLSGATQCEQFL